MRRVGWHEIAAFAVLLLMVLQSPANPASDFLVYYGAGNGDLSVQAHNGGTWLYAWPLQYLFVWCRWVSYPVAEAVWRLVLLVSMIVLADQAGRRGWYGVAILFVCSKGLGLTWEFGNIAPMLVAASFWPIGALAATVVKPYFGLAVLFHVIVGTKGLGMAEIGGPGHPGPGDRVRVAGTAVLTAFKNFPGVRTVRRWRRARLESLAWRVYAGHRQRYNRPWEVSDGKAR